MIAKELSQSAVIALLRSSRKRHERAAALLNVYKKTRADSKLQVNFHNIAPRSNCVCLSLYPSRILLKIEARKASDDSRPETRWQDFALNFNESRLAVRQPGLLHEDRRGYTGRKRVCSLISEEAGGLAAPGVELPPVALVEAVVGLLELLAQLRVRQRAPRPLEHRPIFSLKGITPQEFETVRMVKTCKKLIET